MPFTAAHPVAAVPFAMVLGRFGVVSALVIGSMIPDLPYFLPLGIQSAHIHTLLGLIWFCLPAGLIVYALYHGMAKRPIAALMPARIVQSCRSLETGGFPKGPWPGVVLSILIGAATHITWDAFTHDTGYFVERIPILSAHLFELGGYDVFVYKILQHASSIVGMGIIGGWCVYRIHNAPSDSPKVKRSAASIRVIGYGLVVFVPCAVGTWAAIGAIESGPWLASLRGIVSAMVFSGGKGLVVGTLLYCVFFQFRRSLGWET